jgi:hypothetical protein
MQAVGRERRHRLHARPRTNALGRACCYEVIIGLVACFRFLVCFYLDDAPWVGILFFSLSR